jgi:hypothetical protein
MTYIISCEDSDFEQGLFTPEYCDNVLKEMLKYGWDYVCPNIFINGDADYIFNRVDHATGDFIDTLTNQEIEEQINRLGFHMILRHMFFAGVGVEGFIRDLTETKEEFNKRLLDYALGEYIKENCETLMKTSEHTKGLFGCKNDSDDDIIIDDEYKEIIFDDEKDDEYFNTKRNLEFKIMEFGVRNGMHTTKEGNELVINLLESVNEAENTVELKKYEDDIDLLIKLLNLKKLKEAFNKMKSYNK